MNKELPEYCYAILPTTGEMIVVKRGETGYFPQNPDNAPWGPENMESLNERLGVTKGQAEAMRNGSMFGWDIPASDPNNWDDEGNWIR